MSISSSKPAMEGNRYATSRGNGPSASPRKARRRPWRIEPLEQRVLLAGDVVIAEFMAINDSTLADEDGEFRDWIEIYNTTDRTIDLDGWSLTDNAGNLAKWQFPSVDLPRGGAMVIFASDKDRTDPNSELHTNFRLAGGGEYLAIVEPDGTISHEFAGGYPQQYPDMSFGLVQTVTRVGLVAEDAASRTLIPTGPLAEDWTGGAEPFDDSADPAGWIYGPQGVGFGEGPLLDEVGTDVGSQMLDVNGSAYVRIPFDATTPGAWDELELTIEYNDGYVAYLNGQEIARRYAPATPAWDSTSSPAPAPPAPALPPAAPSPALPPGDDTASPPAPAPEAVESGDDPVPAPPNDLADDFESGGLGTGYQLSSAPGPQILTEGVAPATNSYLRLINQVGGQNNQYRYGVTDPGAWSTINARFDFRASNNANPADGWHFMLVPTADFPDTTSGPMPTAEEPNWPNTFGVGFDVYPNNNEVSAHWNGTEIVRTVPATSIVDLSNGVWNGADVELRQVGNGTNVKVTITPDVQGTPGTPFTVVDQVMPGMLPYEHWIQLGGRTGGAWIDADFDNLSVAYGNSFNQATLPAVVPTGVLQDFDSRGATNFTPIRHQDPDANWSRPGPVLLDEGGTNGAFLRLTNDNVNTNRNSIALDYVDTSAGAGLAQKIGFDFRLTSAGNPADGFAMLLLPTALYGETGPGPDIGTFEQPNLPDTLGIGFRLYNGINDVVVHWDGAEVERVGMDPTLNMDLNSGQFHHAEVLVRPVDGGSMVTVTLTPDALGTPGRPVTVINDLFIAGLDPYEYRVQFGGRTGGAYVNTDLDNITAAGVPMELNQNFDGVGSDYETRQFGTEPAATIIPGGPAGDFLRLVNNGVNNQNNAVAFAQAPGQIGLAQGTEIDFDFRFEATGNPADGVGLLLVPTDAYGSSPTGVSFNEEPSIAGAFGIGLDVYQNPGDADNNHVSLYWDSVKIGDYPFNPATELNLVAGVFHHAAVRLQQVTGGSLVSLALTPDAFGEPPGAPIEVVTDLFVAGMNAYDYRVALAGRTGGATSSADVDNVTSRRIVLPQPDGLEQGFEGTGTDFQSRRFGSVPGPAILNDGPAGNFLRLIHDGANSNFNSIAFDQTPKGINPQGRITADFDFRATSVGAAADGFAMLLLPTDVYGTSGSGAFDGIPFAVEDANFPGVFGLGFDMYPSTTVNDVSVHWDGAELLNVTLDNADLDLDAGVWHHVRLEMVEVAGGTEVTVVFVSDVYGTPGDPVIPINGLLIEGLDLYDYRVEFAGRTGGSYVSVDLDNIDFMSSGFNTDTLDVSEQLGNLAEGTNILAIQGLNATASDPSFLIRASLDARRIELADTGATYYFSTPSPGVPNEAGFTRPAVLPEFSPPGGVYSNSGGDLQVSLFSSSPSAEIRYTVDGTEPTGASPLYAGPITITAATTVRTRAYDPAAGRGPSVVTAESYVIVGSDVDAFNSDLPIVVVDTQSKAIPGSGTNTLASFVTAVIDTDPTAGDRASILGLADFVGEGGMRVRGSSSQSWPKKNYVFETWDDRGEDQSVALLGMPSESDWILFASYLDRSLVREMLVHQLSNDVGQYSVRTRPVEVYLNVDGGPVSQADYYGVYIFMEKIKRDDGRVDVQELRPTYDTEPLITGGYIVKKDRLDPGESGFPGGQAGTLAFVEPKEEEITPEQAAWITNYFAEFEAALTGSNSTDPELGYTKYIDVDSWIDHHILNEMAYNIDGFRLSTFMYIDRGGKLKAGPIWDFDRSLGNSTQLGGATPEGWYHDTISGTNYPWWPTLFADPDFSQAYTDRWQELRTGPLATARVQGMIDGMAAELNEAQQRNYQRWPYLNTVIGPSPIAFPTYQEHVDDLKQWIADRLVWIDAQFTAPATFNQNGGDVDPGFELTVSIPAGTAVYYALDGSDPRLPGGGVSPAAMLYDGSPVTLNENTHVIARAKDPALGWSGPADAVFVVETLPLLVTELNYHPHDPDPASGQGDEDFEFIEVQNVGEVPADLAGVRFIDGVSYSFAPGPLAQDVPTADDFDAPGTAFTATRLGTGTAAGEIDDAGNRVLRLIEGGVGGDDSDNRVAWDQTATITPDRISASFDFRAADSGTIPGLVGTATTSDFDGPGTNYTFRQVNDPPGPVVLPGGPSGNFLRLINDGAINQANRIAFDNTADASYTRIVADFDFRAASVEGANGPADGFSMLLLPTSTFGTTGQGTDAGYPSEEPNLAGVFAIGFDFYLQAGGVNDVSAHWNGTEAINVRLSPSDVNLDAAVFHRVQVELAHADGGAYVTVTLLPDVYGDGGDPVVAIDGFFIAGLNPYESRVEFSGRTGGSYMDVDLDNVNVRYLSGETPVAGLSMALLPVDTYGTAGIGTDAADYTGVPAIAGAVSIDFDLSPESASQTMNVYVDGALRRSIIVPDSIDLASGQFHRAEVLLERIGTGAGLTVTLTPDVLGTPGTPIVLASNVALPGLLPGPSRFELSARRNVADFELYVDNVDVQFSEATPNWLDPGEYVVLVRDPAAFASRYPGVAYEGVYTGRLDNAGETIRLVDTADATVVDFAYDDDGAWPGRADGNGSSLELIDPAAVPADAVPRTAYLEDGNNWRSSAKFAGTPGTAGSVGTGLAGVIVINELLANSDEPETDTIELLNTTGDTVPIGYWFLSDSNANYKKFQIPAGMEIGPFGYLTFDESGFNASGGVDPNDFALSGSRGDDVWLVAADASGNLIEFVDHVDFDATDAGATLGRWPNGIGRLFPTVEPTLGSRNLGPARSDVLISEIHYAPALPTVGTTVTQSELEFVELFNNSGAPLDLSGWRLDGGIEFTFPPGTILPTHGTIVAVSFDPAVDAAKDAEFRAEFGIDASVTLAGPFGGQLNNAGENVKIMRPDLPVGDYVPYILVDQVRYDDASPWPASADGLGDSLTRLDVDAFGDFATSWTAETPTPGNPTLARTGSVVGRYVFYNNSVFDGSTPGIDPADDGAVATDKAALLPEQTATAANYTNYAAGINGVMIGLADSKYAPSITAADFEFHVIDPANPGAWIEGPEPAGVDVRDGMNVGDPDRVAVIWNDRQIVNTWLRVTVAANMATGLAEPDVFYFGNAVGETGNSTADTLVNAADVVVIRDNPRGLANPASVTNPYDLNRDGAVDALDMILARDGATSPLEALKLITPPATPTAAPPAGAEGRRFAPMGEGESTVAGAVVASGSGTSVESIDGLMATQADRAIADRLLHWPVLPQLLRRLGS